MDEVNLNKFLFETGKSVSELQALLQRVQLNFEQYKRDQIELLQAQLKTLIKSTFQHEPISWNIQFIPTSLYLIRATAEHLNINLSPWLECEELGYSGYISWDRPISSELLNKFLSQVYSILQDFIPVLQTKTFSLSNVKSIEEDHTVFFLWNFK